MNAALNNGLLVRADIHTLFDLRLLWTNPRMEVQVASELHGMGYGQLHENELQLPKDRASRLHKVRLKRHAVSARKLRAVCR